MALGGLIGRLLGGNTLYYPGCLSRFASKKVMGNYERILRSAGIEFTVLDSAVCCGSPVLNAGYPTEFRALVRKNVATFRQHGITRIITGCPACFHVLSTHYPREFRVEHVTVTIADALDSGRLAFSKRRKERVTYHDPCHLGRHSGIYEQPRRILRAIGFELLELQGSREHSMCCGGGGGLVRNFNSLANSIAKKRVEQAESLGVKKIVTTCPMCFEHMRANSGGIKVVEFSEAVACAL